MPLNISDRILHDFYLCLMIKWHTTPKVSILTGIIYEHKE